LAFLGFRSWLWRCQGIGIGVSLLLAGLGLSARDAGASDKHAALLLDANSGAILYQNDADAPRHPASLAKLMTLYLVFERLAQGKLELSGKLTISANASAAAPSKLDLEPGEQILLSDAIRALITKSANDIAVALAEHVAGSEDRFARLMTERARQIGMAATTFRNASGLPDDEQVTTARDMATLALRLIDDFPQYYPLFATRTFTYKGETFRNHNSLLFHYKGTDGLKTGYTRASGFNLVASVRRGRKHVIGVVFGGSTAAARNTSMRALLNIGLVKGAAEMTRKHTVVAAAAPPERKAVASARPQPAAVALTAAVAETAKAAAPTASARIEMAQVRPILVGRSPQDRAADGTTNPAVTTIEALIEKSLHADQPAPEHAEASALAPGPLPTARAMPAAVPAAAAAPVLLAQPRLVRGSAPSTLEKQAMLLDRQAAPGLAAPANNGRSSGIEIQIGAFQSASEAQRQLAWVRQRATAVIGQHEAVTQPVKQGDKLFYRARFAGFDGAAAASACKELRALKVECLIMRSD
jgi:D-alanyl-D-alanine carboxypeptidase